MGAHFEPRKGDGFSSVLPGIAPGSLNMLERMLKFDPGTRITVEAALEHEIFTTIRDLSKETTHGSLIMLDFEKEDKLDEAKLRSYYRKAISKYHDDSDAAVAPGTGGY